MTSNEKDGKEKAPLSLPEWAPEGGGKGFACRVQTGVESRHDGVSGSGKSGISSAQFSKNNEKSSTQKVPRRFRRPQLTPEMMAEKVLEGDRMVLAQAITLVESNAPRHTDKAQEMLKILLPHSGNAIRIGITGVPGVGKSTFIEALGCYLVEQGHQVAVLAVDPSSSISGGSILGDKTRMEKLCREPRCYIRPSPSGTTLGGVARKTRETLLLCEAAGFDVILVETVGVGQSEVAVRSMVDFFLLLMLAGAGDELQGIKKGIMEIANALLINKADGENKAPADRARSEYERALHYLQPATEGWTTHAYTCSSLTGEGISEMWQTIQEFKAVTETSGVFHRFRKEQTVKWVHDMVSEHLQERFYKDPEIKRVLPGIEGEVADGAKPAVTAVQELLKVFSGQSSSMN